MFLSPEQLTADFYSSIFFSFHFCAPHRPDFVALHGRRPHLGSGWRSRVVCGRSFLTDWKMGQGEQSHPAGDEVPVSNSMPPCAVTLRASHYLQTQKGRPSRVGIIQLSKHQSSHLPFTMSLMEIQNVLSLAGVGMWLWATGRKQYSNTSGPQQETPDKGPAEKTEIRKAPGFLSLGKQRRRAC